MAQYNFIDDVGLKDILTKIHNFYAAKTELQAEYERALAQETELSQALSAEQARASQAESALAALLNTDISRLEQVLTREISDRSTADAQVKAGLLTALDQAKETLNSRIDSVASDLASEVSGLTQLISANATKEQSDINAVNTKITQETANRVNALSALEQELQADLAAAKTELNATITAKVTQLRNELNTAQSTLEQKDNDLETAITNEATLRARQDRVLDQKIDQVIDDLDLEAKLAAQSANLRSYIDSQLAGLDLEGVKSIIEVPALPSDGGEEDLLYLVQPEHALYHWNGTVWGKVDFDLRVDVESLAAEVNARLQQLQTDLDSEASTREAADVSAEMTLEDHTRTLAQHDADLDALQESVTQLESAVGEDTDTLREDINALREDLGEAQTDIQNLETKIADDLEPLKDDILDLQNQDILINSRIDGVLIRTAASEEAIETQNNSILGVESALNTHSKNQENPHKVTAAQIGLDKVNNTSDMEKPVSAAMSEALSAKVNVSDIKDSLTSTEADRPLSARQGAVLSGLVQDAENKILALGNAFRFKGTVPSVSELPETAEQGECWQIKDPDDPEAEDTGAMYSWTGTEWVPISASVVDISAYAMSLAEVYSIIDNFIAE